MTRPAIAALALLSLSPLAAHAQYGIWFKGRATALAPHAPAAQWQVSLGEYKREYVDQMMMAGSEHVLVGITDGPYLMLDAATGEVAWSYKRDQPTDGYLILQTAPVVVVTRSKGDDHRLLALHPSSGKRLWQDDGDTSRLVTSSPDGLALLVAERKGSELALRFLDVTSGELRWRAAAPVGAGEVPELLFTDSAIFIIGATVSALSRTDGAIAWSQPGVGPVPELSYPTRHGDGVLVPGPGGRLTRLTDDGAVAWRTTMPGSIGAIMADEAAIVVQTGASGTDQDSVSRVSPETGEALWSVPVGGRLFSNLVITGDKLVFTRFDPDAYLNVLAVVDMASGRRGWETRLQLCGANRLPDVLVAFPGKVTLAQENVVASYDLATGERLWRHELEWTQGYAWALERLASKRGRFDELVAQLKGKDPQAAGRQTLAEVNVDRSAFREFWRNKQEETFQRTSPILRSGSGASSWERQQAMRDRLFAVSGAKVQLQIDQAFGRMQSQMNFMFSALAAAAAMQRGRIQGYIEETRTDIENVRGSLNGALAIHAGMIQGPYYIHPIVHPSRSDAHEPTDRGAWWGYLMVDLATGRWSPVITSVPHEIIFSFFELFYREQRSYANQLPTLSPDGRRLISRGIGLTPDRWRPLKRGSATIAYPSILSVNVADLVFHEPGAFASRTAYGFIDTTGTLVAPPLFAAAGSHVTGRALVHCSGFRGFVDRAGEFVVPPRYKRVLPYSDSAAAVQRFDLQYLFLDRSGRQIAGGKTWRWVDQFVDGLAPARVGEEGDSYGFIDKNGEWAMPPNYDGAYGFTEGVAPVARGDEWLFIDRTQAVRGRVERPRIGLQLSEWPSSRECLTCIMDEKKSEWPSREGLFKITKDGKYGYVNHAGEVVIAPEYAAARPFSEGLAAVKVQGSGDTVGFIDKSGALVIAPRFPWAMDFSQGVAAVRIDYERQGFVNRHGEIVIDSLAKVRPFSEGLAPVAIDQARLEREWNLSDPLGGPVWGYINGEGTFVIPPQFRDAGPFSEGLAWVRPLERPLVPVPPGGSKR